MTLTWYGQDFIQHICMRAAHLCLLCALKKAYLACFQLFILYWVFKYVFFVALCFFLLFPVFQISNCFFYYFQYSRFQICCQTHISSIFDILEGSNFSINQFCNFVYGWLDFWYPSFFFLWVSVDSSETLLTGFQEMKFLYLPSSKFFVLYNFQAPYWQINC